MMYDTHANEKNLRKDAEAMTEEKDHDRYYEEQCPQ